MFFVTILIGSYSMKCRKCERDHHISLCIQKEEVRDKYIAMNKQLDMATFS